MSDVELDRGFGGGGACLGRLGWRLERGDGFIERYE